MRCDVDVFMMIMLLYEINLHLPVRAGHSCEMMVEEDWSWRVAIKWNKRKKKQKYQIFWRWITSSSRFMSPKWLYAFCMSTTRRRNKANAFSYGNHWSKIDVKNETASRLMGSTFENSLAKNTLAKLVIPIVFYSLRIVWNWEMHFLGFPSIWFHLFDNSIQFTHPLLRFDCK